MEDLNQNTNEKPVSSEDRERTSKVLQRLVRMAKSIDGLNGKTAEEIFNSENEDARRELLATLTDEQYCQLITGVNGILKGKEKEDWGMDGVGVTAIGYEVRGAHIFPRQADKKDILIKSWQGAQQMNASGRDLGEIGMLLGSILVETHPFGDGNGRTSRFVYSMLKDGYSEEEITKLMGEYGRDKLDMALSKRYIDVLFEEKYSRFNDETNKYKIHQIFPADDVDYSFKDLKFPEGTSEEAKEGIIQGGRNDENILTSAFIHFFNTHPEIDAEKYIKLFGERRVLLVQNLLNVLPKETIKELAEVYWNMKKKYTEDMIDIFVNPDNPEYKIERDGKEMRVLDYFKDRIARGEMLF